jgi:hypothetical protein
VKSVSQIRSSQDFLAGGQAHKLVVVGAVEEISKPEDRKSGNRKSNRIHHVQEEALLAEVCINEGKYEVRYVCI